MTKLPAIMGKDLLSALSKAGFEIIRIRGSHHYVRHPDGRSSVIPVHPGEIVGPGLLLKILKNCECTREELINLL